MEGGAIGVGLFSVGEALFPSHRDFVVGGMVMREVKCYPAFSFFG